MKRVLFVCTGNICRSPTAEGVLRKRAAEQGVAVQVDSAGTHGYHVGEPPDPRSVRAAAQRGYDISGIRARKLGHGDFADYDYLVALDEGHLEIMRRVCPPEQQHKLFAMMAFAPHLGHTEVPDPYYGPPQGFEQVLDLLEEASEGLLAELLRRP